MAKRLYAAYGSNINIGQMVYRCPTAMVVGTSKLPGYRLCFKGRLGNAHATVIPSGKKQAVPLLIWEITELDEKALDRYEGVSGGYYYKDTVEVEVNGKMEKALIYIMSPNPFNVPSLMYYNTIWSGYNQVGFPEETLREAMRFTDTQLRKRRPRKQV